MSIESWPSVQREAEGIPARASLDRTLKPRTPREKGKQGQIVQAKDSPPPKIQALTK